MLYRFVPPSEINEAVLATLANAIAGISRFSEDWHTTGWFDETMLWLAPEPAGLFRALTDAVSDALPDYPPSEGQLDVMVICGTTSPGSWRTIGELPLGQSSGRVGWPGRLRPFCA